MRTFIAIEVPEGVRRSLATLVERLRSSEARLTWVKPEAMHLTLRFLGEIDGDRVERLRALLSEGYADAAAFDLAVRGLGAFPNPRRPSVLWAGVEPVDGPLARVREIAERAAQAIGLAAENRAFHPHLTLARVKDPAEADRVRPFWERERDFEAGTFTAGGVTLFSSRLTPRGPVYTVVQEFQFAR